MIRKAEISDLKDIFRMGKASYNFARFAEQGLKFNSDWFSDYILKLILSANVYFSLAVREDKVIGSFVGELLPWTFDNSQILASEKWWWIDPEARGGRDAFRLIDDFCKWAKEKNAVQVYLAAMNVKNSLTLDRIYKRMGFKLLETHYAKGL